MVVGCAALAWRAGYGVFGIEFSGECWAAPAGHDYAQAGPTAIDDDWSTCIYGVGIGGNIISVYEFW